MTDERIAPPGLLRATIQVRAPGTPDEDDMAAINRLARSPLKAEDVYCFDCVPSTDALDSYFTRQAMSSLNNYACDAMTGVAVMNSHRTSPSLGGVELPLGRSYYGEVQAGEEISRLFAKAYLLRDYQPNKDTANTATLIRGIESGITHDLSIGFQPGWYRCSVCNRDLFDRDCPHYPGARYEGVRAYAWVEEAHMREFSFVYAGATPGAGILKAERAYEDGTLDRKLVSELEDCYQVRLARRWAVPDLGNARRSGEVDAARSGQRAAQPTNDEGGEPMKGTEFLDLVEAALQQRVGRELSSANVQTLRGIRESIEGAGDTLEEAAGQIADLLARVEGEEDDERVATLERQIADLTPLAETGKRYRADLIEEALKSGVRVFGNAFQTELHRRMFERATLDETKAVAGDCERLAQDKLGPGGSQTAPVELPTSEPVPIRRTGQYKG